MIGSGTKQTTEQEELGECLRKLPARGEGAGEKTNIVCAVCFM